MLPLYHTMTDRVGLIIVRHGEHHDCKAFNAMDGEITSNVRNSFLVTKWIDLNSCKWLIKLKWEDTQLCTELIIFFVTNRSDIKQLPMD